MENIDLFSHDAIQEFTVTPDPDSPSRIIKLNRLAMAIECEGSITIGMTPPTKTRDRLSFYSLVGFTNTNAELMREICESLNSEGVSFVLRACGFSPCSRKVKYQLIVHGFLRVIKTLELIMPYLDSKRRQAEIVLAFTESRKRHSHSEYTDQEWMWVEEVRTLNGRMPTPKAVEKYRKMLSGIDYSKHPRSYKYFVKYIEICDRLKEKLDLPRSLKVSPVVERWINSD